VYTWAGSNGYTFGSAGQCGDGTTDTQHPVTKIDWDDSVVWCNAFSEMEGRTPCYFTDRTRTTVYRNSTLGLDLTSDWVDWDATGFRLPTEVRTHAVGELQANDLGVFDMTGNVSEWIYDLNYYGDATHNYYYECQQLGSVVDPPGIDPRSGINPIQRV
jgi:formylglycine-generating enzyme required for sulfatase activity